MIVTHENTNIPFDSLPSRQENEVYEYYIQPTNTKQLQTVETANTWLQKKKKKKTQLNTRSKKPH